MLQTSDNVRMFLDTRKIAWLLQHKAISKIDFEKSFLIDSKSIDDRNKSDLFIRVLAVGQALWFCVSIIARGVQHLPVTTLEVTTIGIIVDSVLAYYFWKDKPADVESMEIVYINNSLEALVSLEEDDEARKRPSFRTRLDFASRSNQTPNLLYNYMINILKSMWPRTWRSCNEESLGRRSDNDILPITGVSLVIASCSTATFLATNFIAWDFHFPTPTERLLWRISSCGLMAGLLPGMVVVMHTYTDDKITRMQANVQQRRRKLEESAHCEKRGWKDRLVHSWRLLAVKIGNNSLDKDPNLDVSVPFALGGSFVFEMYFFLRAYLLLEDVIAFRAMPADVYKTVDWWAFIPHIG